MIEKMMDRAVTKMLFMEIKTSTKVFGKSIV